MFRIAAAVLTAFVALVTVGGASVAVASGTTAHSSRHGAERIVIVGTSTRSGPFSVIATGFFTDGGTVNIFSANPAIKLGAGTIRLATKAGPAKFRFNRTTCLATIAGRGTYRISHGTGKYARLSGSGRFSTIGRDVFPHKSNGTCASSHPLAFQAIVTLTGSVSQRG